VVTGGARAQVESALVGLPARPVFNPHFEQDHMALSLSVGLAALGPTASAALVALGDQPQIQTNVTTLLLDAYQQDRSPLIMPSFQMRRGHPWIIARSLWNAIMAIKPPTTLRDFLHAHSEQIHYVDVGNDTIFRDLDTPGDYKRERPPPGAY
jgi:molybdenum cofactor cytidylyltransferase